MFLCAVSFPCVSAPREAEQLLAVIATPHPLQVPRATESPHPQKRCSLGPVVTAFPSAVQLCLTTVLSAPATVSPSEQGFRLPGLEVSTQSLGFQTRCSAAKALGDAASDRVWQVGLRCPKIHHFKPQAHF